MLTAPPRGSAEGEIRGLDVEPSDSSDPYRGGSGQGWVPPSGPGSQTDDALVVVRAGCGPCRARARAGGDAGRGDRRGRGRVRLPLAGGLAALPVRDDARGSAPRGAVRPDARSSLPHDAGERMVLWRPPYRCAARVAETALGPSRHLRRAHGCPGRSLLAGRRAGRSITRRWFSSGEMAVATSIGRVRADTGRAT